MKKSIFIFFFLLFSQSSTTMELPQSKNTTTQLTQFGQTKFNNFVDQIWQNEIAHEKNAIAKVVHLCETDRTFKNKFFNLIELARFYSYPENINNIQEVHTIPTTLNEAIKQCDKSTSFIESNGVIAKNVTMFLLLKNNLRENIIAALTQIANNTHIFHSMFSKEEKHYLLYTIANLIMRFDQFLYIDLDHDFPEKTTIENEIIFSEFAVCVCPKVMTSERILIALMIFDRIFAQFYPGEKITITSIGSGELLQEYIIASELVRYGYTAQLVAVDNDANWPELQKKFMSSLHFQNKKMSLHCFDTMDDYEKSCTLYPALKPEVILAIDLESSIIESLQTENISQVTGVHIESDVGTENHQIYATVTLKNNNQARISVTTNLLQNPAFTDLPAIMELLKKCIENTDRQTALSKTYGLLSQLFPQLVNLRSDPYYLVQKCFESVKKPNTLLINSSLHQIHTYEPNYNPANYISPLDLFNSAQAVDESHEITLLYH